MDFYETIKIRKSVRKYANKKIEKKVLDRILEAVRIAPSGCNAQPWKFIVVSDRELKQNLVPACRNQKFIAEADIVIVACGNPELAYPRQGGYMNAFPIDVAIAVEHLCLAAAVEGLGTCWIGAFDENEVKKVMKISDPWRVVALTPLGYPAETPPDRGRKPVSEIICYNKWEE
ncbi:MAG: nitroreductase family protein [bacterium]|nr:nitroreductase family protein [bacterium]